MGASGAALAIEGVGSAQSAAASIAGGEVQSDYYKYLANNANLPTF